MLEFIRDFWGFLKERKKFWLLPMLVIFGLLAVLTFLAETTAVGPFLYTIF